MAGVYLVPVPERAPGEPDRAAAAGFSRHIVPTDLDGAFAITGVRPGNYYVVAEKSGYVLPLTVRSREQMSKPDKATADLMGRLLTPAGVAANHATQVEATIYRGAALSGTMRFDDGTPVAGAMVSLSRRGREGKWSTVATEPMGQGGSRNTDDEGRYRIGGLAEGEYLIHVSLKLNDYEVSSSNGGEGVSSSSRYSLEVYLGGAFRESAGKAVKVGEGEESAGLDLTVPLSTLHALSGAVVRVGSGRVVNAAKVSLRWHDTGEELTSAKVQAADDTFHFAYVPEGEYTLHVSDAHDVVRTEIPNCAECVPRTHTDERVVQRFGDADQALVLHTDQQAVTVAVPPVAAAK